MVSVLIGEQVTPSLLNKKIYIPQVAQVQAVCDII